MADSASTPERKLTQHPFFSCNSSGDKLFAVVDGVRPIDALQSASCFLDSARAVSLEAADGADEASGRLIYASAYLVEIAKAAIDAATSSLLQSERDRA